VIWKRKKVKKDTFFGKSNKSSKEQAVSESTESMDSNSDSDSSNTSESDQNSKRKDFKRKRKVNSGMVAKASDDVQNSQTWSQNWSQEKYMLSGCELIDTENISLPSQNMKFVGK
jgi:hypothetical protein